MNVKLKKLTASLFAGMLTACGGSSENPTNTDQGTALTVSISGISTANERSQYTLQTSTNGSAATNYQWSVASTTSPGNAITLTPQTGGTVQIDIAEIIASGQATISVTATDGSKQSFDTHVISITEVDEPLLPPMPDAITNDSTLLGVDSDSDGIRDDIEHAIYNLHKESLSEREIIRNAAKAYTSVLLSTQNQQSTEDASQSLLMAVDCIMFHSDMDAQTVLATLRGLTFNTNERATAFEQYNLARSGSIQGDIVFEPADCKYAQQ